MGSPGATGLSFQYSPEPDTGLHCEWETTDMGLVHRVVSVYSATFTGQHSFCLPAGNGHANRPRWVYTASPLLLLPETAVVRSRTAVQYDLPNRAIDANPLRHGVNRINESVLRLGVSV